jgi:hypothetical protein
MAKKGIDYSKWDKLQYSDDSEDDSEKAEAPPPRPANFGGFSSESAGSPAMGGMGGFGAMGSRSGYPMEKSMAYMTAAVRHSQNTVEKIEFEFDDPDMYSIPISYPEHCLETMKNPDEIAIRSDSIRLIVNYPLSGEFEFEIKSPSPQGFTRKGLVQEIANLYQKVMHFAWIL